MKKCIKSMSSKILSDIFSSLIGDFIIALFPLAFFLYFWKSFLSFAEKNGILFLGISVLLFILDILFLILYIKSSMELKKEKKKFFLLQQSMNKNDSPHVSYDPHFSWPHH